jgi:hypothetical protein
MQDISQNAKNISLTYKNAGYIKTSKPHENPEKKSEIYKKSIRARA